MRKTRIVRINAAAHVHFFTRARDIFRVSNRIVGFHTNAFRVRRINERRFVQNLKRGERSAHCAKQVGQENPRATFVVIHPFRAGKRFFKQRQDILPARAAVVFSQRHQIPQIRDAIIVFISGFRKGGAFSQSAESAELFASLRYRKAVLRLAPCALKFFPPAEFPWENKFSEKTKIAKRTKNRTFTRNLLKRRD